MASPSNCAGFRPANLPGPMAGHQPVHAGTDGRGEREVEQGNEGPQWRQDPGKLAEGEESSVNLSARGHYAHRSPRLPGGYAGHERRQPATVRFEVQVRQPVPEIERVQDGHASNAQRAEAVVND